ncbi:hypothetical protein FRC11_006883, partial [Ceratobasidium sp. 423]
HDAVNAAAVKDAGAEAGSEADSDCDSAMCSSVEDVQMRSNDFTFDTPGAGPSNMQPQILEDTKDEEPFWFFKDKWDGNVLIDSDSDDGRPEGPTLMENVPWLQGLTAIDILGQELEAELTQSGGCTLTDNDMKAVWAFNYKVDTDMSACAYGKLPQAFPDELGNIPKHCALHTHMVHLSGIKGVQIDCCVNSCMAFTNPFDTLNYCLFCFENHYHPSNDPDA